MIFHSLSSGSLWLRTSNAIHAVAALLMLLSNSKSIDAAQTGTAKEQTVRLIRGLRERRLFDLAEFTCHQALADNASNKATDNPVDTASLVRFTIELIHIRTDRARSASPDQQDIAWQAAAQTASNFLIDHPDHPRKILIQLQHALLAMQRVEFLRGRTAPSVRSTKLAEQALELSQKAKSQLLAIQETAQQQLIDTRSGHARANGLTDVELAYLQRNVRFQLAICGFHRADLYPADETLNRTSAIADVIEQLQTLQRTNEVGEPLWWQTQLALVRAQRIAEDFKQSQALLERTAEADLKPTRRGWTSQILTEQVELMLARGVDPSSADSANQLLRLVNRVTPSPTLDLACLRLVVAVAASTKEESKRKPWAERSRELVTRISQRHGAWWGQQATHIADTIITGISVKNAADQLTRMMQTAQEAFDRGDFGDAFSDFETAGKLAEASQMIDFHRRCVLSSSQALEKMGQHADAAGRQIALAQVYPQHSSAPSIHLRGCWNLGQAITLDNANHPGTHTLTNALAQHLATWPRSSTNDQAKLWLGKRQLVSGDLDAGIQTLLSVDSSSQHRIAAGITAAGALREAKQHAKASEVLNELATRQPNDVRVLLELARNETHQALLAPSKNADSIARSLKRWRTIAKQHKPETNTWFEAKLSVIRLLAISGETAGAKQLLNYLNALPNGWRQSTFAEDFEVLQRSLR